MSQTQVNSIDINTQRKKIIEWKQQLKDILLINHSGDIDLFLVEINKLNLFFISNYNKTNDFIENNSYNLINMIKKCSYGKYINFDIFPKIFPIYKNIISSFPIKNTSFIKGKFLNNLLLIDFGQNLFCFFFLYKNDLRQGYLKINQNINIDKIFENKKFIDFIRKYINQINDEKAKTNFDNLNIFIFKYTNNNDLELNNNKNISQIKNISDKNNYNNISQITNNSNKIKKNNILGNEIKKKEIKNTVYINKNNNTNQIFEIKNNNNENDFWDNSKTQIYQQNEYNNIDKKLLNNKNPNLKNNITYYKKIPIDSINEINVEKNELKNYEKINKRDNINGNEIENDLSKRLNDVNPKRNIKKKKF